MEWENGPRPPARGRHDLEMDREYLRWMVDHIISVWYRDMYIDPEAPEVIEALKPRYRTALITNWDHASWIHRWLEESSIDRLAELCNINKESRILVVGCGTGGNSCYLANRYGCTVIGIDVAEHMVKHGQERAESLGLTDRVTFQVGDAYDLQFPEASFYAVITVFVSQFLDPRKAYPGFHRVLKPGGHLGINEMYRADDVPQEAFARVEEGEEVFREITELPFTLRTPSTWNEAFQAAGFTDIAIEEYANISQQSASLGMVEEFGGWGKIAGTLWEMLVIALRSSKIRQLFGKISRGKRVLLRDKVASKYIGYILCAGRRP